MERAFFGFACEIDVNPGRFFSLDYLLNLINQENEAAGRFGKTFLTLLTLNGLSLSYVQGAKLDLKLFGVQYSTIPGAVEVLCLFLGLVLFGFVGQALDTIMLSRMRYAIVSRALHTDLVNMATAHMKGQGIWGDLIIPRYIGYSSGTIQSGAAAFAAFLMLGPKPNKVIVG